jgi:hypothetical protein
MSLRAITFLVCGSVRLLNFRYHGIELIEDLIFTRHAVANSTDRDATLALSAHGAY